MTEINFNAIKLTQALVKCRSITPEDDEIGRAHV